MHHLWPSHCIVALLVLAKTTWAQENRPSPPLPSVSPEAVASRNLSPANTPERPAFESPRFLEDWSFLRDPARRTGQMDALKYVPLNRAGDRYLSIGGEARPIFEFFSRNDWGGAPRDRDGYLLQRYALHGDLHLGPRLRFFGQLYSALENGKLGGPDPPDEDRLDVRQLFVEVGSIGLDGHEENGREANTGNGSREWALRVGRQEMAFGSQRLISVREGPNVRRSFVGARVLMSGQKWRADAFVARPLTTARGTFDDRRDRTQGLSGLYATRPLSIVLGGNVDVYLLRTINREAEFAQGSGRERRNTLGARLWGERVGQNGTLDYNFEAALQGGQFGASRIRAWTVASDTGLTFSRTRFAPRLGLRADIASGDRDPNDATLGTFNPLYPKGDYFGESVLLGPSHFIDVQPSLALQLSARLSLAGRYTAFWRQSTRDGIYDPAGNLLRAGSATRARYVGGESSFVLEWQRDVHTTVGVAYSHFFAGSFLRESGAGRDVDFLQLRAAFKF